MRKATGIILAGLLALSLIPGAATAGGAQHVDGSIAMMAPFSSTEGVAISCYSGLHRRINVVAQGHVNGVVGYHFDVDKKTWGGKFKLDVTGGQGDVDLDITYYPEFGTVEQAADTTYAPPTVAYEERGPGGEAGVVPKGMNKAIVCMYQGAAAEFSYHALPPKKKKKK